MIDEKGKKIGITFGCCNAYHRIYINKDGLLTKANTINIFLELKVITAHGDKGKQVFRTRQSSCFKT